MYREVLQALATELGIVTGLPVIKGRPLLGQNTFKPPCVALLCDALPEPPTRNGACAGGGVLSWTVTAFGASEAVGLELIEGIVAWLGARPQLTVNDCPVTLKRAGPGVRQPNDMNLLELEHAFSVSLTTYWQVTE